MALHRSLFIIIAALIFSVACSSFTQKDQQVLATQFYQHIEGDNAEAAAKMLAFPPMSAQDAAAMDQKFKLVVQEASLNFKSKGGIDHVKIVKSTMDEAGEKVDLELVLHFKDQSTHNDRMTLVKTSNGWKIN